MAIGNLYKTPKGKSEILGKAKHLDFGALTGGLSGAGESLYHEEESGVYEAEVMQDMIDVVIETNRPYIKIKCEALYGNNTECPLCYVPAPFFVLPLKEGDKVWIKCNQGNAMYPYLYRLAEDYEEEFTGKFDLPQASSKSGEEDADGDGEPDWSEFNSGIEFDDQGGGYHEIVPSGGSGSSASGEGGESEEVVEWPEGYETVSGIKLGQDAYIIACGEEVKEPQYLCIHFGNNLLYLDKEQVLAYGEKKVQWHSAETFRLQADKDARMAIGEMVKIDVKGNEETPDTEGGNSSTSLSSGRNRNATRQGEGEEEESKGDIEIEIDAKIKATIKDEVEKILEKKLTATFQEEIELTLQKKLTATIQEEVELALQKKLTLETQEDAEITASSSLKLKGSSGVEIDGSSSAKLKGTSIELDGTTVKIKGTNVDIGNGALTVG